MPGAVKKSLYIYLCSLMGALLFLILHRVVVFFYLISLSSGLGSFGGGDSYLQFLALDYFTLLLAVLAGLWYGIWVGSYWYEAIYEKGEHGGLVHHLARHYWPTPRPRYNLQSRVAAAAEKIDSQMWELEDLVKKETEVHIKPVRRRVARKKA